MNSTVENSTASQTMIIIAATCSTLNFICSITGSIGNLLILLSYYCYQKMRSITNLHLCNLALVDLIVCVIIQPLYITSLLKKLSNTEQHVYFETFRKILTWCIMTVACGSLTTVMLDRYCCVSFPLKYRKIINKRRTYLVILFPWVVGFFAAIMLIFNRNAKIIIQSYVIFLLVGMIIPGYIRVFVIARRQTRKMASRMKYLEQISLKHLPQTPRDISEKKLCKSSDYEAIKTIFIVIISFIICWAPLVFFPFYYRFASLKSQSNLLSIFPVINTLALGSSSINPFIYCLRTPPFKHSFQQIIFRAYKTVACGVKTVK